MPRNELKDSLIEKKLGLVGDMYLNNYGVEISILKDGKILLQQNRLTNYIPFHHLIVSREFYDKELSSYNGLNDYERVTKELELKPPPKTID
mgnify:CR=1 FL=1